MKIQNILLTLGCAAMLVGCSDDFLENKPQGSLSDGVMNSTDAIDLLVNSAYASLSGFTNEQGDPWVRPTTNWSFGISMLWKHSRYRAITVILTESGLTSTARYHDVTRP